MTNAEEKEEQVFQIAEILRRDCNTTWGSTDWNNPAYDNQAKRLYKLGIRATE